MGVTTNGYGLPWQLSGKESSTMQEMQVQPLDREKMQILTLEKEMAMHLSNLA